MQQTHDLTADELKRVIALVYQKSGITLHEGKRELVQARLLRRVRDLGLESPSEYVRHLESGSSAQEMTRFLDAMTTNHTSFFREPLHFRILREQVLPAFASKVAIGGLDGWCAASSTGEEPYTITMTLLEAGCSKFRLMASDLSTNALKQAKAGVYPIDRLAGIPQPLLKKYFERGMGAQEGWGRVNETTRRHVEYRQLNLLEIGTLERTYDFIFCRNVMIYFDLPVRKKVVAMLERHLAPGGFLFIAHSESLTGTDHRLKRIGSAAFQKAAA